ncbi:MAG: ArsR family transcriptional regulator [Akkermansiaceae bacterium]
MMREAGWLTCQKTGLHIYYSLACDCLDDFLCCVDSLSTNSNCS